MFIYKIIFIFVYQDVPSETTINIEDSKPGVGPTVITRSTCPYSGVNPDLDTDVDEELAIKFDSAYKHYGSGKSR
jgi:hypothetical protein